MLSIKDYLVLKRIYDYLEQKRDEEIRENNGYSNQPVNKLTEMKEALCKIIHKLEEEE